MRIDEIRIAGTSADRRVRLTKEQKAAIVKEREENGTSYNKLAKMYGVTPRTITFVCNPKVYEEAKKKRAAELRANPIQKELATERQRKVRAYKKMLNELS